MTAPLQRRSRWIGLFARFVAPAVVLGGLCALVFGNVNHRELMRLAMIADAFLLLALTLVVHRMSRQGSH